MEREGKGREGLRRGPEAIQKNDAKKKGKGAEKMQAGQGALRTPTGLLGRLPGMRGPREAPTGPPGTGGAVSSVRPQGWA